MKFYGSVGVDGDTQLGDVVHDSSGLSGRVRAVTEIAESKTPVQAM